MRKEAHKIYRFGRKSFEASHLDKPFFRRAGIRKGDLLDYYERVAMRMLPHLKGRPLNLLRAPDGLRGDRFYQQEVPDHFPSWIHIVRVKKESGSIRHVVCNDKATLLYLADQACVTLNTWLSTARAPRRPDRIIFDLDPSDTRGFADVAFAARKLRDLLRGLGAEPFLMLTGSSGAHVVVPIVAGPSFDETRAFARAVAERLAGRHPDRMTTAMRKTARKGRLFIDCLRNSYGQTAVAPYTVRLRPGAPVAAPIAWDELKASMTSWRFTVKNIGRRLASKKDPWKGFAQHKARLKTLRTAFEKK